jgi:crotonobetainyl-CoA:carnitine CoA-transferase CaiB-like acyl-CoA transferase
VTAVGALSGVRVLDLSRVLAGPWASQMLGDFGAEVLKIERPGEGDDTRHWGPPFLTVDSETTDSAYYTCCNRNKESLAIDLSRAEGSALVRRLASISDVVIENFRPGHLAKYGLDYKALASLRPDLIYCSITGFGQTGPYSHRGGYDFLIQGMSGLMSITGRPNTGNGSEPLKVGIPVSDLFTGVYACVSVLAALLHRNRTGEGQHIDASLLDTQLAALSNQAASYMVGGRTPGPLGNQHPSVVPYRDFETADGRLLIAITNDRQFQKFCTLLHLSHLGTDQRFNTNAARHENRIALEEILSASIRAWRSSELSAAMEDAQLPAAPLNRIDQIINDPHVAERNLLHILEREDGAKVPVIGYPHRLSGSPTSLRKAPPRLGQDTREVLRRLLCLDDLELDSLESAGTIADYVSVRPE